MNPVLLKPGSDQTSQVVVLGRPWADVSAMSYRQHKAALLEISLECLADLRSRYDVVVCEGAGSPAEINLRATDIANMGLARAAQLPVLVVGDINPGGVFAAMFGTLALLSPRTRRWCAASSSTSSAATSPCSSRASRCSSASPAGRRTASCRGPTASSSTSRTPSG
jgi:adenosylcobyric acid synthase